MVKVEIIFDISYLLIVLISACLLFGTSQAGSIRFLYAVMALILGMGDAFHLIPRVGAMLDKTHRSHVVSLGVGKFITSITMTVFYLILWEIGLAYYGFEVNPIINAVVYGLAILRIILCILPFNKWTEENGSFLWGILRNIPFVALGLAVMIIFIKGAAMHGGHLPFLWLAILLSFLFYVPVVIWSGRYPKIGMFMMPKTCAYIAIVLMGFWI